MACDDLHAQATRTPVSPQMSTSAKLLQCEGIKSINIVNTTITTADPVAAGTFKSPVPGFPGLPVDYSKLPAFCRVSGSIKLTSDSDIRFELWLPSETWNGRFMQTGNGGAAGAIVYNSLADPLARGYAVANTDTGHQGMAGDFSWAYGHPEKLTDYAYRAVHELTVAGKAITAAFYGKSAEKSYWNGCSTGGRQGLKEAQRYPDDYDAIIAGAPASNWSPLMALSILIQNNLGPGGLGVDKLGILKEAAIAACDAVDSVTDHVITNPSTCIFDPGSTQCSAGQTEQCLSADEVAAARRIYAGVVDNTGQIRIPGTGPGSEPLWAAYASPQFSIGTSYFRNVVAKDPTWEPASFAVDTDLARAEQVDGGSHDAMDPDISAFIMRGGKLITYHGTIDGLIPYVNSVNYFESMVSTLGKDAVNDSVRLYLVPGMSHCSGGDGAHAIDWLAAMEDWAEQGKAPAALPGTHPAPAQPPATGAPVAGNEFTRPVCPYPEIPRYKGSGNINAADSFECQ
jgi:feruloyl esterase